MLTDMRTIKKLGRIQQYYEALRFQKVADVPAEICQTREHFRNEPRPGAKIRWQAAKPGAKWGGSWLTAWFRGKVKLTKACDGERVGIRARTGGETLFFVGGEPSGVFDDNHPVITLTNRAKTGQTFRLAFEAYAGHTFPGTQPHETGPLVEKDSRVFEGIELVVERQDITAFAFDLKVLLQLIAALDENSLRRGKIIQRLAGVYRLISAMPQETPEEIWREKLFEARKIMQPLLRSKNGPTTPLIGIIGHSHIDTAWLWPLAETWRKCARTFSSILTLMDQYPELIWIQSAPCHTEKVRDLYPGLFKRIQKAVKTGKWEPNGAMWVEPDCNIPSGESFVRQLLVGQRATREMFGYTSDTMWMPDVFGYSAALPQILRGCYVDNFCTTKITWNDTTRFPYDTFEWKGIDGSSVVAHYNTIHCWPDPVTLTAQWNWVQHKDAQDRRLCAFGFGDGGGGPMAEMLEIARRVEDLEGCPKAQYTTVSDFMKSMADEMPSLPDYSGELYLEFHRGTLTSIAKIKRGNRKTELALRDAELLCTLAALRGAKYPAAPLLDLWKTLLTNQFHDILPGSSIQAVNEEAVKTFDRCIAETETLSAAALAKLGATPARGGKPPRLLVVNTLSWDRTGEIVLDGAPAGMHPADPAVTSQWIEDVQGRRKLVVGGLTIPALGAVVVELAKGKPSGESPFTISANRIDTPHATVTFDKIGRIVSLVDRASGREVVQRPGGQLNTLLKGEDIPEQWDNWDIDSDQEMKMKIEDRLVSREVVANGPLQLRLRSEYKLGRRSRLVQDMVFHTHSPRIDFETVVDWGEKHRLVKAAFELDVLADTARHEIQYGHVERPTHRNLPGDRAKFEVCAHKWTDLSDNGFGVALLNDCKYGVSVKGGELGLTLIKSGTHPDPRGDEGRHEFTYAILPHACGFSVESVVRPAYELNVPVKVAPAGAKAEGFDGLLSVDAPNVMVESVKWAEEGKAFVVRLYEAGKAGCRVNVRFNCPIRSVSETNLMEEKPKNLSVKKHTVQLAMRAFEIKTLRVTV
ncbi:MAG: alpha-mannosidase [Phycisphaerae bacterium]|nr:alpha-mannosidase [Phycisphaerae bacterium]